MELGELGGKLLADTLPAADGSAVWTEQDESLVTHAAERFQKQGRCVWMSPDGGGSIACVMCLLRPILRLLVA